MTVNKEQEQERPSRASKLREFQRRTMKSEKENTSTQNAALKVDTKPKTKLTPTWMFNAALLSTPVDLSSLVALSRDEPEAILGEVGLLNKMVDKCLNASEKSVKVDKDTRLDVSHQSPLSNYPLILLY